MDLFSQKLKITQLTCLAVLHSFPATQQLLTKLVTGPMACGAVMVPTTMFMGQVVTAFAPQQGQPQTISIAQQPSAQTADQQTHTQAQTQATATAQQQGQNQAQLTQQQTQFLQVQLFLLLNRTALIKMHILS